MSHPLVAQTAQLRVLIAAVKPKDMEGDPPNSSIKEIFRNGNVILTLDTASDENRAPIRLRVSPQVLSTGSLYFQNLFKAEWRGKQLESATADAPLEITEQFEDVKTAWMMSLICSILHHRAEAAPSTKSPESILKFAHVAQYYQCTSAVRWVASPWIKAALEKSEGQPDSMARFDTLLEASYVLDSPMDFLNVSKAWALHWKQGSSAILYAKGNDAVVPLFAYVDIEQQSKLVYNTIYQSPAQGSAYTADVLPRHESQFGAEDTQPFD
ncbi:hypothetical protein NA57DRAFT_56751 [Rhizodiscina lignyota]|uniref:BTB domain-containing protein n=1 Tax=Rhizodiscina lignyota TaxID=1504668 RepID=A0A9P4MAW8_9PEZI|nr:hypothetical protein NA57DRAFT_56751 [Rhizodiscina lignyota]